MSRERLEQLDKEWRKNPVGVVAEVRALLKPKMLDRREIPYALGIAGSAFRQQLKFSKAKSHILKGIEIARRNKDPHEEGRLRQRLSVVWSQLSEYKEAFRENERAVLAHLFCPLSCVGRCLVDRGFLFRSIEDFDASRKSYETALERLSGDESEHRFSSFQGLSELAMQRGDLTEALRLSDLAKSYETFPEAIARLLWSDGLILARLGELSASEKKISEALEILREVAQSNSGDWGSVPAIDAALASIDLCKVYLNQAKSHEAHILAISMVKFVGPIARLAPVAAAAIQELALIAKRGEVLTSALILKVEAEVKKAARSLAGQASRKG